MSSVTLQVKVKPRSKKSSFSQQTDGSWIAQIKAPPVDGKANDELIALVAQHFRCHKSAVVIKAGTSGRIKLVKVEAGT